MVYVAPAVIGAFWGAPMVARELEAGTHRLVWNQSITRNRWLATKLGLGMLGAVAAGAVAGLAMTWWSRPIDGAVNAGQAPTATIFDLARIAPEVFGSRGIAPIGYAAFAFALGVAAGALLRRYRAGDGRHAGGLCPHPDRDAELGPAPSGRAGPGATLITAENLQGFSGPGPDQPIDRLEVEFERPGAWQLSTETVDASGSEVGTVPSWVTDCLGLRAPRRRRQLPRSRPASTGSPTRATANRSRTSRPVTTGRCSGGRPESCSPVRCSLARGVLAGEAGLLRGRVSTPAAGAEVGAHCPHDACHDALLHEALDGAHPRRRGDPRARALRQR